MTTVSVAPKKWALILELRKRQDYHAFSLGVLEAEFLKKRGALLEPLLNTTAPGDRSDLERLGALQWDHYQKQMFWYEKIKQTEEAQRVAGESALKEVGVDPNGGGDFSIVDGAVLELRRGEWVPLERG